MRALVVEDDPRISETLRSALGAAGMVVECESDGEVACFRGENEEFDAVILDLGLPSLDGLTILKRWRKVRRRMPVLILTAQGDWEDRVEGIEAGADDYVAKPFHVEEVVARIRALIRRAGGAASPRIEFAEFVLDTRLMQVTQRGVRVPLTPQEFKLVEYLVHNRGRVVPQIELVEHIYSQHFERESNSIEVLVARVRKRLGAHVIETRRGFGYVIESTDP